MTKEQFQTERTRIISKMLDNPDEHGIYQTTKCYQEFDELYEKLTSDNSDYTAPPKSCDSCKNKKDCRFIGNVCRYYISQDF